MTDPFEGWDKHKLFNYGKKQLWSFLFANGLEQPKNILTYDEARENPNWYEARLLGKLESGPHQGTGTGWYHNGYIFVCLQRSSRVITHPGFQNWSHPHYRVDREPCGVVCHEGGHHVQEVLRKLGRFDERGWKEAVLKGQERLISSTRFRTTGKPKIKRVTNYEPVLDESWAESMRLFILNPGLLQAGLEARYNFHHAGLRSDVHQHAGLAEPDGRLPSELHQASGELDRPINCPRPVLARRNVNTPVSR